MKDAKQTNRSNVKKILSKFPETRNDDRLLCVTFWKEIDHVETVDDIQFATPPEAIRRARQWLNERGFFLATDPDVLKRRRQFAADIEKCITSN